MRFVRTFIVIAVMLLAGAGLSAQHRPVPDFLVRGGADQEIASSVMSAQPKWLLVYVAPDCRPCNTLMRALPKWQSAELMVRVVLVVAGPTAEARTWVANSLPPEMQTLTWYADPERAASKALKLAGAPVLIGVRNGQIEWQLAGVLNDPAALESVVRSWVEDRK